MPSEQLTFDEDKSPLQWLVTPGPLHYIAINHPDPNKNIFAIVANPTSQTDHFGITAPVGSIDALTFLQLLIKFKLTSLGLAAWFGVEWSAWALGGKIGTLGDTYGNGTMYERTIQIPIVGGAAEGADLSLQLETEGGGWTFGAAVIQVYQIIPTLLYTEPFVGVRRQIAVDTPIENEIEASSPIPTAIAIDTPIEDEVEVETDVSHHTIAVDTPIEDTIEIISSLTKDE